MNAKLDSGAARGLRRIRFMIWVSLALAFCTVAAARVHTLWMQRSQILATAGQQSQNTAALVADNFKLLIDGIDRELLRINRFVTQVGLAKYEPALTEVLWQSLPSLRGVGSLSILDSAGIIKHSTLSPIVGESRADRPLLRALLADPTADLVADAPVPSRSTALTLIPLGRRIHSVTGELLGAIVATLEFERLREHYRHYDVGTNGAVWIVHTDGHLLFRSPLSSAGHRQLLPLDHPLLTLPAITSSSHVHISALERDGPRYLTSIRDLGVRNVRIAVSLSEEDVLAGWHTDVARSVFFLSLLLLTLLFVSLLVDRIIRGRVREAEFHIAQARRFQKILDFAPLTVTIKDRDGKLSYANEEFLRRVNKTREEIVGLTLHDVLPTDYADKLVALDEKVLQTKSESTDEVRSHEPRTYLSTKFPLIDENGEVDGIGSISLDITETKAMQTINFRIFEKSLDLILVTDSKGNLLRVSPSVTAILGYRPDEVEGHNASEFIYAPDLQATRNEMRMARKGAISRDFVSRYHHKDGRVVELSWTGMWVQEEQQHFFIGHDMTERVKLESELRHSQKMEAIGRLTGGIAHDYNNLLTVILGNTELLIEGLRGSEDLLPMAQSVLDAADRSEVLTQRLLAFGRRQALESEPTDISSLVRDMNDLFRFTVGEGVRMDFALDPEPWIVNVDRNQLETAILNLVVNARDAMDGRGILRIETSKTEIDDLASIVPDLKDGNYMMLAVTDSGSGMDAETLSRAFEPFFTTKDTGKGTGLGLSMVYGFVKQSGGHARIYSEPGHGTVVKLFFPVTDRAASGRPSADRFADLVELPRGTESILVVEDDALVRENTERQLIALGYRVVVVGSGAEALRQLRSGYRPDLLLTDVILGGELNGKELADKAREIDAGIRVMFMSGYTSGVLADPATGEIPESTMFIGKPFRHSQLARAVREALESKVTETA